MLFAKSIFWQPYIGVPQARHRVIVVGIRNDLASKYYYRVPSTELYKNVDNSARNAIENPPIPENAFNADLPEELKLHVKGAKISQIYRRLEPDKPSYTVTGSGGGGTHMYHWSEPRALTNREKARLQTFPDSYEFIGSKESVRKQVGMAVPCRGARIIFEAIMKTFAGIDYPSQEAKL